MEEKIKNYLTTFLIALLVTLTVVKFVPQKITTLGGYTAGYWDSADGYKVDGTTVIDGSGNVDAAVTSGSASTFASTVTVTGETNLDTLVRGGDVTDLGGQAGATTTAAQICNSSIITFYTTLNASSTVGLPMAADLIADCIPATGDSKSVYLWNSGTTTASFTIKADKGLDASTTILLYDADKASAVSLAGGEWAFLEFTNINGVTTTCMVQGLENAD